MDRKDIIIFLSTFITFSFEAILHYNIGKNGMTNIVFPSLSDIIKLISVVMIFSFANTIVNNLLESIFNRRRKHV